MSKPKKYANKVGRVGSNIEMGTVWTVIVSVKYASLQ